MQSSKQRGESLVPAARAELRQRLVWLTVFRTGATTLMLGAFSIALFNRPGHELSLSDAMSFGVIGLVYVSTLVYGVVLRRRAVHRLAGVAQVAGDVIIATALVVVTGGVESPFTFTYSLAVVGAAVVVHRTGAAITSGICAASYTALLVLGESGALGIPALSMGRATYLLASNYVALLLIAVLSGYLSGQLRSQQGQIKAREADLKRLSTLHGQILSSVPSGLITCDAEGRVTFVNPSAANILSLAPESALPVHLESLIPGALHGGGSSSRKEVVVTTAAGVRTLGMSVTELEGSTGAHLIVFQDLTELRRIEEGLKRADRLAALGALAAQLAHEIRNPLASMRGAAQLIAQDASEDPTSARLTNILVRESDRLSKLVEEFLRFARPPAPAKRVLDLSALVNETVEMLRSDPLSKGVTLETQLVPIHAAVDADQIRQVLINLVRNAMQAVEGAGTVKVSLGQAEEGPAITVWDSKGGIPTANLPRLFEPFFTTRQGGTGLGLATAHSIIRAHGGDIWVESSPATGTQFVVALGSGASGG